MAAALGNIGETEKQAAAAKKALELSDRLPERLRYQIQITAYYASQATWAQAVDACNKLLAKYPDDVTGLTYLANIYDEVEQSEKALPLREHVVSLSPTPMFLQNRGGNVLPPWEVRGSAKGDRARCCERPKERGSARRSRKHLHGPWAV
jgi:tetratricopeptide (TPR) repeat protein